MYFPDHWGSMACFLNETFLNGRLSSFAYLVWFCRLLENSAAKLESHPSIILNVNNSTQLNFASPTGQVEKLITIVLDSKKYGKKTG
jgi:hypothetical protein